MSSVYVVFSRSAGESEDEETLEAVFATEKLAKKFILLQCQGLYRYEEYGVRTEL